MTAPCHHASCWSCSGLLAAAQEARAVVVDRIGREVVGIIVRAAEGAAALDAAALLEAQLRRRVVQRPEGHALQHVLGRVLVVAVLVLVAVGHVGRDEQVAAVLLALDLHHVADLLRPGAAAAAEALARLHALVVTPVVVLGRGGVEVARRGVGAPEHLVVVAHAVVVVVAADPLKEKAAPREGRGRGAVRKQVKTLLRVRIVARGTRAPGLHRVRRSVPKDSRESGAERVVNGVDLAP
mmetsp:Transcript_3370/g.12236  ORF Transcript_3370/g.12236 Transcript_3370/m.12236 type:complete len:239 (+) Transcript_3370:709-1425(+)